MERQGFASGEGLILTLYFLTLLLIGLVLFQNWGARA